ncbi:MAG: aminotransferase class IV [Rhizobiales bacterium]|nr:aminotransferase class IV [Hyphomicrobiales bacterium]
MSTVWFNGEIVEGPLPLDPRDRGLLLGDGAFETIAAFNGHAVWLDDHLDRLMIAASVLGLNIKRETVAEGVKQTLRGRHGILRITVTRGSTSRGLGAIEPGHGNLMVTFSPWIKGMLFQPARLITSSIRRSPDSVTSRHKTLSYADNIAAAREASLRSADDALMLNTHGRVACATVANIFVLEGDTLSTPLDSTEGVLNGITSRHILGSLADGLGLVSACTGIEPARLFGADAVFMTNSLRLVRPVTEIDGRALPKAGGEIVKKIFDRICRDIERDTGADPRKVDHP